MMEMFWMLVYPACYTRENIVELFNDFINVKAEESNAVSCPAHLRVAACPPRRISKVFWSNGQTWIWIDVKQARIFTRRLKEKRFSFRMNVQSDNEPLLEPISFDRMANFGRYSSEIHATFLGYFFPRSHSLSLPMITADRIRARSDETISPCYPVTL